MGNASSKYPVAAVRAKCISLGNLQGLCLTSAAIGPGGVEPGVLGLGLGVLGRTGGTVKRQVGREAFWGLVDFAVGQS